MRPYLSVMLAALITGLVSAQNSGTCKEEKKSTCCMAFGDLNQPLIAKAFGDDIKMPEGLLGAGCSRPEGGCSFMQKEMKCLYFTSKYTGIAAGCSK